MRTRSIISTPLSSNERAPVFDLHFHPVEPLSARVTLAASF
jgi:hypothetical protein